MLENVLFVMSIIYVMYLIIKVLYDVTKWVLNFQLNYVGLIDSSKTKAELGCGSQITAQEMYKSMLKEEYKTMRRLEFLKVYDLCFSLSIGSGWFYEKDLCCGS